MQSLAFNFLPPGSWFLKEISDSWAQGALKYWPLQSLYFTFMTSSLIFSGFTFNGIWFFFKGPWLFSMSFLMSVIHQRLSNYITCPWNYSFIPHSYSIERHTLNLTCLPTWQYLMEGNERKKIQFSLYIKKNIFYSSLFSYQSLCMH